MEAITSWVNCILAVIIFIGIIEIVVPEGETRKFVFLITGAVTSFIIAAPIIKFFSGDFNFVDIFDVKFSESDFYYTDTWGTTYGKQSEILEEVFAENVVNQFNLMYSDMRISECKIAFSHDENGKIIEIREVKVRCENHVDDIELLKRRVGMICEITSEKVRVG